MSTFPLLDFYLNFNLTGEKEKLAVRTDSLYIIMTPNEENIENWLLSSYNKIYVTIMFCWTCKSS